VWRLNLRIVGLAVLAALAAAACSSSSKPATSATSPPGSTVTTSAATGATVSIGTSHLGKVLVNQAGRTLYIYDKDTPGVTKCTGQCPLAWPPVVATGTATYGAGLSASMFSTLKRPDGSRQVTVNGLPLYTYTGDAKAGDATGQGLGDFYAAGSNGKMIGHAP
jgi:predicted lipoprotein with Yx(FWY)xxD motif